MKEKPNPILEIVELCDIDGGEALTYFSKGVHDPIAFSAELLKEYDIVVRPENVKTCYMRWEWHNGPDGPVMCGEPHIKPGRGKFVVTYCEEWDAWEPKPQGEAAPGGEGTK